MPSTKARDKVSNIRPKKNKKETDTIAYERYTTGLDVALSYGFSHIQTPKVTDADLKASKGLKEIKMPESAEFSFPHAEEKAALLRTYMEGGMQSLPQPVMVFYEGRIGGGHKDPKERRYNLDILGTTKSIAEAIIIQTTLAILRESGFTDLVVELNSLGDRDSLARFSRELAAHYREHMSNLPASCREKARKNVFEALTCGHEKCQEVRAAAPHAINFLTEASRTHFKELLEYLECSESAYRINDALMADKEYCSHTVFKVVGNEKGEEPKTLAFGIRYNALSKKVGFKKELGSAGITISFKKKDTEKAPAKKVKIPQFYLIHMGEEAKRKSLSILEMLREDGIRVSHTVTRDKLGAQLSVAEQMATTHLIIMGQKEYHEGVVLVRRTSDRSQETIKMTELANYLKNL